MNNISKKVEALGDTIKSVLEKISLQTGGYFVHIFYIFLLISLYHFFPELFNYKYLATFFTAYFIVYIFYKKDFFHDFIGSYVSTLSISLKIIKTFLIYIIFFGIFIYHIGGQDISLLDGSMMLLYIVMILLTFDYKNEEMLKIEKYNYKKRDFYMMAIVINVLLFLYFGRILYMNNIPNTLYIIGFLLIIFNISLYLVFTDFFNKIVKKIKNKYNAKYN